MPGRWGDNWNVATWAASIPGLWNVAHWNDGRWYSTIAFWSRDKWDGTRTWG